MWGWRARTATVVVVVVVVGGAGAAPGNQGRQFFNGAGNSLGIGALGNANAIGYNTQGHANTINYVSRNGNTGYGTGSIQHTQQATNGQTLQTQVSPDYYSGTSQQYLPNTAGYYGFYQQASPDYAHDAYVPAWHGTGTAAAHGTDSSPALSALALLGFLYFLNLIQGVLQDNSGRRRRSVPALGLEGGRMEAHKEEEEGHYITSYLEEEPVRGGDRMDGTEEHEEEKIDHKAEPRAFSFLEDFFIRLPQALGMQKRQMIDRLGLDKEPMGIASFISSRVKMISSIMSFLQDPSPSRIRRDVQDTDYEELVEGKTFSEPFPSPSLESFVALMTEVLKEYSPFNLWPVGEGRAFSQESDKMAAEEESDERSVRERRHSPTSMNAWYSELGGRNKEAGGGVGSIVAKAISFLGGGDLAQQAAKQETGPTLLELSRGLGGSSPHCLQRVLCRLTSHASQLSLFPRVALQMLSSNLVDGSEDAVKAGLRGENCSQTFAECDAETKLGKTQE